MSAQRAPVVLAAGFLFDLDGVLVDSTAAVERHWRRLAAMHDLDASSLLTHVHGRRAADVIRDLGPRLSAPTEHVIAEFAAHDTADQAGVVALPGAAETLERLPTDCWGVVTSGSNRVARARLAASSLPIPRFFVTADDVEVGKPDPAPYRLGAELLGLAPGSCLAVEDAPLGLTSAVAAGCRTLALLTTHTADQLMGAGETAHDLTAVELHYLAL